MYVQEWRKCNYKAESKTRQPEPIYNQITPVWSKWSGGVNARSGDIFKGSAIS